MLFFPFSAACNWATLPPSYSASPLAAWLNYCIHLARKSQYNRSLVHDGGGLLDPKDAFKSLFVRGKVPLRGSIGVSVEEGLLRSIAADATGDTDNALYDQTLTRASGAGLLFNQVVRRMSHAVVSGSSDAVLSVLRRL